MSIGALPAVFGTMGGAIQRRVAETALEQARRGHDVLVLTPASDTGEDWIDGILRCGLAPRAPGPGRYLEYQVRALRRACAWRPDVLHVHSEPEAALLGGRLGVPMVLNYDNYFFRTGIGRRVAPLYRRALRRFSALMACSDYARRESIAHWDLPPERTFVVPNGVYVNAFAPRPDEARAERGRLGLGHDPVVLYVGRVCAQKGTDVLLAAQQHLLARPGPPVLLIAGPVEGFAADGRAGAADWPARMAAGGARYLGAVPDARLAGLMSAADVFVMPTRELEMQGMAALEAQACGTPVVATDHGGLPETVPRGCGTLVPVDDPAALSEAVSELLNDPQRRHAWGRAAREHAEAFSWPRVCDRLDEVYARVVAAGASRR